MADHPETPRLDSHLDLIGLDALRAGEGTAADADHAAGCAVCREALLGLSRLAGRVAASAPVLRVPAEVDAVVLERARRELGRRALGSRCGPITQRWRRWTAAAAMLLGACGLGLWLTQRAPGDVDGSGRVDIVDAYTLALKLKTGARLERRWDVSGDGRVDSSDVEAIARQAVRIEGKQP